MKILVIADTDDFTWRGGEGQADVLISCGDVCDQLVMQAAEAYTSSPLGVRVIGCRCPMPLLRWALPGAWIHITKLDVT